jgi:hypothetical protein
MPGDIIQAFNGQIYQNFTGPTAQAQADAFRNNISWTDSTFMAVREPDLHNTSILS